MNTIPSEPSMKYNESVNTGGSFTSATCIVRLDTPDVNEPSDTSKERIWVEAVSKSRPIPITDIV